MGRSISSKGGPYEKDALNRAGPCNPFSCLNFQSWSKWWQSINYCYPVPSHWRPCLCSPSLVLESYRIPEEGLLFSYIGILKKSTQQGGWTCQQVWRQAGKSKASLFHILYVGNIRWCGPDLGWVILPLIIIKKPLHRHAQKLGF